MKTSFILLLSLFVHGCFAQEVPPPPSPVSSEIIELCDVEAQFPGGMNGLNKYLHMQLKYPEEAIVNGEEGKVYVSFVVETDGSITNVSIDRGVTESLDAEAKRLITQMPKWSPGQFQGKAVRTRMRLPIAFTLN